MYNLFNDKFIRQNSFIQLPYEEAVDEDLQPYPVDTLCKMKKAKRIGKVLQ